MENITGKNYSKFMLNTNISIKYEMLQRIKTLEYEI
jgi:hypothetical protein